VSEPTTTPAAVTEQARAIPVPGTGKVIHGLLHEVPRAPLVVLVHCLTGGKNSTKYYLGARALERAGFSSFRFDLYGYADDARKLLDYTVETHAVDLARSPSYRSTPSAIGAVLTRLAPAPGMIVQVPGSPPSMPLGRSARM
jgi:hypothetical protein